MGKAPTASFESQKTRRSYGKKTKTKGKTTVIDNATFTDLVKLKDDGLDQYGQPKRTKDEYVRYQKRGREFLEDFVQKRRDKPPSPPDGISNDELAKAFEKIPNRYSAYALMMFITQKCLNEGNGISTAQGIHGAWCYEWDNADGTQYSGTYKYDKETGKVTGCPARAPEVTKLIRAVKTRAGQKGAAAERHHADAMLYEDITKIMQRSNETHPVSMLSERKALSLLAQILIHVMFRAFLPTGFVLWTRNFETCKLQWRDITLNCTNEGNTYIRVHLDNRKGWQNKQGWNGPLGTNTYHIYKQDLDSIDMYTHLLTWIGVLQKELGRDLVDDDYIFPSISTNGTINPKQEMTHDYVQGLLNQFTRDAGVERYYSTHCLRRGGAQYRMIYAPLQDRWDMHRIRWWGGWAEGESVDTLMKYLLDALQRYECGHADALAPKAKAEPHDLLEAGSSDRYATKADIKEMEQALLSAMQELTLQNSVAPLAVENTNINARLPAPWQPSFHAASGLMYYLAPNPQTSFTATSSVGNSYVPMLVLNPALPQTRMAGPPIHPLPVQSAPTWHPASAQQHSPVNLPALDQSTQAAGVHSTNLTPIPQINRHPDLPRAGLHIPHLNRADPKAWLVAVCQWEEGIPEENIPPLRDWEKGWYQGRGRTQFGANRRLRQVIAEEYSRLGRSDKAFEKLYGHCRGTAAIVDEIRAKRPDVRRRKSKNGSPEERDARF